jgi:hypothetical protein
MIMRRRVPRTAQQVTARKPRRASTGMGGRVQPVRPKAPVKPK